MAAIGSRVVALLVLAGMLAGVVALGSGAALAQGSPPGSPFTVFGMTDLDEVTVYWSDLQETAITKWQYQTSTDFITYTAWTDIADSDATTTELVLENVPTNSLFCVKVRAVNEHGSGVPSQQNCSSTTEMPELLSVSPVVEGDSSHTDVTLTLTLVAPAIVDTTSFITISNLLSGPAQVGADCSDLDPDLDADWCFTTAQSLDSSGMPQGYPITVAQGERTGTLTLRVLGDTIDEDDEYTYLLAEQGFGVVRFTITDDDGKPSAPSALTAAAAVAQATLSWTAPPGDVTGYKIRYKKTSATNWGAWAAISNSASLTSHTLTGLDIGDEYQFQLRAVNPSGDGAPSIKVTATPHTVPAPTSLTATGGTDQAALSWTAPTGTLTGYKLRYKKTSDSDWGAWTAIPNSASFTSHTLTGLDGGVEYQFQLRALTADGDGSPSATATATTLSSQTSAPGPPTSLTATSGVSSATLRWTAPTGWVTGYKLRYKKTGALAWGEWTAISNSALLTSHTLTGLDAGWQYQFQLRAVNGNGDGTASATVTATPKPEAPSSVTATPGGKQVTLSWWAPSGALTGYKVRYKETSEPSWGPWRSRSAAFTSWTATGLQAGLEYQFQVRAVTAGGDGAISTTVKATPTSRPAAPSGLTATAGVERVTLGWTDPDDATITGYQYRQRKGNRGWGSWTDISGSDATTTSHAVTGLEAGSRYRFQLRAVNGETSSTVEARPTTTPSSSAPAAPTNLTVTPGVSSATLRWTAPAGTVTGYKLRYRKAGALTWGEWTAISNSALLTSHTVTGLDVGSQYQFQLRAVNANGDGTVSATATATPTPAAPSSVTATPGGERVTLSWRAPSGLITGYKVRYKKTSASNWGAWQSRSPASTSWTATGLDGGVEYQFQVRAVNAGGDGAISTTVKATPTSRPAAPSGLTATAGVERVTLGWTDPDDAMITGYQYRQRKGSGSWGSWTDISGSDATTTSHAVTGLEAGSRYRFQLRAVNGETSSTVEARPTAQVSTLAAPTSLTATAGVDEVALSWTAPSGTLTGYKLRYKKTSASAWGAWTAISNSAALTAHTVTGLDGGSEYQFQLRAVNAGGDGTVSATVKATPAAATPSAPTSLTATAGVDEVALSWTAPSGTLTGYKLRYKKTSASAWGAWTAISNSAALTAHTVTGLDGGSEYQFQLRAVNAGGDGTVSSTATATPTVATLAAPTSLTATAGVEQVALSWTAPAGTVTGYKLRYKKTSAPTWGAWTAISNSAALTAHTVTGLDGGSEYQFQLRAVNAGGDGTVSSTATATPTVATLAAPTSLTATAGVEQVALSWTAPSGTLTGYKLRYKKTSAPTWGAWTAISSSAALTSHTVTGLDGGSEYQFQLRAVSAGGDGTVSTTATATPTVATPAAPTSLTATAGVERVVLGWTAPAGTVTGYKLRYKKTSAPTWGAWTAISSSAALTAHTVMGLDGGSEYQFQLRAVNAGGDGTVSSTATATPTVATLAAPTSLTATAGVERVVLGWTAPAGTVTGYKLRYKKTSAPTWGAWTAISNSALLTSHTVMGLDGGSEYQFQLRAVNAGGDGTVSSTATATPTVATLAAPTSLTATAGVERVVLGWTVPAGTVTGYKLRYKKTSAPTWGAWTAISNSALLTSHTVMGLDGGSEYQFQLRAVNAGGDGTVSSTATATPTVATLAAPTSLTATAGVERVVLGWTVPAGTVTGYKLRYKKTSAPTWGAWTAISNSALLTSHTVMGLDGGSEYQFQLRAVNAGGDGTVSSTATATPTVATPAAPTSLTATVGVERVVLGWTAPAGTVTGYKLRYKKTSAPTWGAWTAISNSALLTSHTVTGLDGGSEYQFQLRAVNAGGDGTVSSTATATPTVATPAAPTSLTATVGVERVVLGWTAPAGTVTGYKLRYKKTGALTWGAWATISNSALLTSHTVTGLDGGSEYQFQLRAVNAGGDGTVSSTATATPTVQTSTATPAAPTGLTTTAGTEQVALRWTAPAGTLTGYKLRYKKTSAATWGAWRSRSAAFTSYTATGLQAGVEYQFQVRAVNANGDGAISATVRATPTQRVSTTTATPTTTETLTVDSQSPTSAVSFGPSSPRRAMAGDTDTTPRDGYVDDPSSMEPTTIIAGTGTTELSLSILSANNKPAWASTIASIVITTTGGTLSTEQIGPAGAKIDQPATCKINGQAACEIDLTSLKTSGKQLPAKIRIQLKAPASPGMAAVAATVISVGQVFQPSPLQIKFSGPAISLSIGAAPSNVLGYNVGDDVGDTGMDARDQITFMLDATDASGFAAKVPTVSAMVRDANGGLVAQSKYQTTQSESMMNRLMLDIDAAMSSALATGAYTLEITSGTLKASTTFMVVGAADEVELTLTPLPATEIGQSVTASVMVTDAIGNVVADGVSVAFGVSDLVGDDAVVAVLDDASAMTVVGKASTTLTVVGAGLALVWATVSDDTTPERDLEVLVSTAGAPETPNAEASLDCLSALRRFSTWACSVDSTASVIFGLASPRGATALHMWNGSAWVRYSVVDGMLVPGSSDFAVARSDLLYISN